MVTSENVKKRKLSKIKKNEVPPPPPPPPPPVSALASSSTISAPLKQPIVPNLEKRALVLNKLQAQRENGNLIDREALLHSIRQGIPLRKTEINDKSGLHVDKQLVAEIKTQPKAPPPCPINEKELKKLQPSLSPLPPTATTPKILVDPEKRANVLNKINQNVNKKQKVDRDALLKSIQTGVTLRKTKTNDKSGLFVDKDLISEIKTQPDAPLPCSFILPNDQKPVPVLASPPPPPVVIIADPQKRANVLNKITAQKNNAPVDRDALLRSIQTGVNLRKTKTNDRSGLFVDNDLILELKSRPETPCSINSFDSINRAASVNNLTTTSSGWESGSDTEHSPQVFVKSSSAVPSDTKTLPPIVANPQKREKIMNMLSARNANKVPVDREELMRSIRGGVALRKTETNDRSGLVLDNEILSNLENKTKTSTSLTSLDSQEINATASSSGCETDYSSQKTPPSINLPHLITVNNNTSDSETESVISFKSSSKDNSNHNINYNQLTTLKVNSNDNISLNTSLSNSPNSTTSSLKSFCSSNSSKVQNESTKKNNFVYEKNNSKVAKENTENKIIDNNTQSKITAFQCMASENKDNLKPKPLNSVGSPCRSPRTQSLAKLFESNDKNQSSLTNGFTTFKNKNLTKHNKTKKEQNYEKMKNKFDTNNLLQNTDADEIVSNTVSTKNKPKTKTSFSLKSEQSEIPNLEPPPLPESEPPPLNNFRKMRIESSTNNLIDNGKKNNKLLKTENMPAKKEFLKKDENNNDFQKIRQTFNSIDTKKKTFK